MSKYGGVVKLSLSNMIPNMIISCNDLESRCWPYVTMCIELHTVHRYMLYHVISVQKLGLNGHPIVAYLVFTHFSVANYLTSKDSTRHGYCHNLSHSNAVMC